MAESKETSKSGLRAEMMLRTGGSLGPSSTGSSAAARTVEAGSTSSASPSERTMAVSSCWKAMEICSVSAEMAAKSKAGASVSGSLGISTFMSGSR
ncbi:hypothetical protein D3C78_1776550 [compost metagenome]